MAESHQSKLFFNEAPESTTNLNSEAGFFMNFKRRLSHGSPLPNLNQKILRSYPSLSALLQKTAQAPELNLTKSPKPQNKSRKGSVTSLCSTCSLSSEVSKNHIATPDPSFEDSIHFQLGFDMRKDQPIHDFDRMVQTGYGNTINGRMYTLQLTLTPELIREESSEELLTDSFLL